jgi:exodeoxyribonuclease V beta subunit
MPWKEAIIEMIWKTLTLPLKIEQKYFSLIDLEVSHVQTEMEFLFESSPHFIKGFIDLVFFFDHKYYIVDWKTNWLGPDSSCYVVLDEAMTAHDYWLQAALYSEALCRHVKQFDTSPFEKIFGGVFYFFVRGGGVCHFTPDLNLIKKVTDEV